MRGHKRRSGHAGQAANDRFRRPLANLIDDGRRRIDRVESALNEIDHQYRGRTEDRSYRQFITALSLANQAARQYLVASEKTATQLPEEAYDAARSLMKGFSGKHEKQVDALRPVRAEELEVFAQPFTRLAKKLLPNVEVLFFGWRLEGYELRVYDRERAAEFTGGAPVNIEREFGAEFQFLQFWHPQLRQSDLFQHAAFAHELAHPAIRCRPPRHVVDALAASQSSPNYANVAVDAAHTEVKERGRQHTLEQQRRLALWFDEIACDIVGTRLLGPCFPIAFVEVTAVNWDFERNERHDRTRYPPTAMRMKFMAEELERFRLPPKFEERLRPALELMMQSTVRAVDPDDEIPGAEEWMRIAVDIFRRHCVDTLLNRQELSPQMLADEIAEIWRLIDSGIPPAEKLTVMHEPLPAVPAGKLTQWSREYDWRLILNVARIGLLDPQLDSEQGWRLTRGDASRLATGAIEMAEFHRRARILRRQYGQLGPVEREHDSR